MLSRNLQQFVRCCRRRGATLVEVLIIVVVMGILGTLVIPAMAESGTLRVQAAVRSLVADITFIQGDALAYQTRRAMWFGKVPEWDEADQKWVFVDGNGYTVVEVRGSSVDLETDYLPDPEKPSLPFARDFSEERFGGAVIADVDFNDDVLLIFDELGGPVRNLTGPDPGSGGSLRINGPNSTFEVVVEPYTGRVRVTEL